MLDSAMDFVKDTFGMGGDNKPVTLESIYETPYKAENTNWYKALPYGFKFTPRNGDAITCYLPISPENIAVTTHFGTNILATLYGTIEEHSEQRYYDIVISGTTGFAPKYVGPFKGDVANIDEKTKKPIITGRKSYKDSKSEVGLDPNIAGGFMQKTLGAINKMMENFNGVQINSGIKANMSGYIAFHNMYRFLLAYKKDTSTGTKARKAHPLTFLNYKDNQKYDCAITKFDLKRSASSPQLYNYVIAFRAYNLQDLKNDEDMQKAAGMNSRLKDLGLDDMKGSLFQKMKQTSNGAKGLIGAFQGGLNVLGG